MTDYPRKGCVQGHVLSDNIYLGNGARQTHGRNGSLIGNRTWWPIE